MLRKLFVLILLSTIFSLVIYAQDPAPKADSEKTVERELSFVFGGGSYLGVEIKEVTKKNYADFGLSEVRGVAISKVIGDSPAEKAGLKAGDVVVGFNGESVTSSRKLTRLIREVAPDHTASLTVIRAGSEISIPVTIVKRSGPRFSGGNFVFTTPPDVPVVPGFEMPSVPRVQVVPGGTRSSRGYVFSFGSRRRIGIGVGTMTKQLGEYFGVENGRGVLVNRVSKDSPAERAGLRAGDVIVEVNGKEIKRRSDLVRGINAEKEGDVTLTIIRDKNRQTVTVTPDAGKTPEMLFERLKTESRLRRVAPKGVYRVGPKARGLSPLARPLIVGAGTRVLR